ncbi:hypothetical protein [Sphingosinicella terrae]|uniref:hypothetical protein n=1 Tax=Sphingosinicella terrae TaxID=2172047 RepID=UPI000E0DAF42|nr:hypothetical protein [Sphingosinicella terrae]
MSRRSSGRRRRSRSGKSASAEAAAAAALPWTTVWPRLIAAGLAALGLVFLIYRYSVANALLELGPEMAATVAPGHPEVQLERAYDELRFAGDPTAATEEATMQAFGRAPLSEVPLLIGARRADALGDGRRADRLVSMAARRNPRSRYVLLLALDKHIRNGRVTEAAVTMGVLTRVFSDIGPFLVSELARMAVDPAARPAVRHVMASDPGIRSALLEQLARDGSDPAMIVELAGAEPRPAPGQVAPRWQRLLLDNLVDRGRTEDAFRIWRQIVRPDAVALAGGVYDPGFEDRPGPPPFNWSFVSGSHGYAEPAGQSGELQALYYGRDNVELATQLIRLEPGRYRISFAADGEADGEHGLLTWTLACHRAGTRLVTVPIVGVDFASKPFSESFTVPAEGCANQWLRLVGQAAEFPEDQRVTISGLRIERDGGR